MDFNKIGVVDHSRLILPIIHYQKANIFKLVIITSDNYIYISGLGIRKLSEILTL